MIIKEIMSDMNDKMSSQFFDGWTQKSQERSEGDTWTD